MSPTEKERFWQEHFSVRLASGLPQAEYRRQHDLKFSNFAYWLLAHPQQPEAAQTHALNGAGISV